MMRLITKWRDSGLPATIKQGTSGKNRISHNNSWLLAFRPLAREQQTIVATRRVAEKVRQLEAHLDAVERDAPARLALPRCHANAPLAEVFWLVAPLISTFRHATARSVRSFGKGYSSNRLVALKRLGKSPPDRDWRRCSAISRRGREPRCWRTRAALHLIATSPRAGSPSHQRQLALLLPGRRGIEKSALLHPAQTGTGVIISAKSKSRCRRWRQKTFDRLQADIATLKPNTPPSAPPMPRCAQRWSGVCKP